MGKNIKVLLIEDNPDDAELIKRKLAKSASAPFAVAPAKTLKDGLEHLSRHACDLVLLDLGLPDSHGLDTVSTILNQTPQTPVVILSGFDDEATALKAVQLGAQDYLVKGHMESGQMERAMFYAIERSRLQAELEQYTQELWKTEANLRKILEKNADAILVVGEDKRILFTNPAAETLLGRKQKVLLNESFEFSLNGGKTSEIEITRTGGETIIAEMNVVDISWEGKLARLASLRDITQRKQAELISQKEKRRAQNYLDIAGAMLLALDTSGKVTMVNKKGCEILERKEKDITGKDWFDNFIPEDIREDLRKIFYLIISGEIDKYRHVGGHRVLCKNGREKFVDWNNSVVRDENGRITGTLSSGEDVTERKSAEEALRESEERFSKAFRSSPEMMMITTLKDGRYVEINESFTRITGYTREDVIGKKSTEIDTWVDSDARAKILAKLKKNGRIFNEETQFRVKSGETHTMLFSAEQANIGGEPCLISVNVDITERKKAEEALRESEERFSAAFRYSPEIIVISNLDDGSIMETNETFFRLTGYTRKEVSGKKSSEIGIWANPGERTEMVGILKEKGAVRNKEYTFRMKSGELRTWLFSAEIVNITNKPCMLSVTTDITERKKAEQLLRFSDAAFKSIHESVIAMDTKYVITHWNEISEQIYGLKAADAIGRKLLDVIEIVESYPTQNVKRFEILETNGFYHEEQLHRTKHGEVWVDLNLQAIEDSGSRYGWVMLGTAITQRKLAEEALKRSEEKYRELIRSSHDGIVSMDAQMRVIIWNKGAENIFGFTEKERLGESVLTIISEKDREEVARKLGNPGASPVSSRTLDIAGLKKNGTEVPVEISISSRKSDQTYITTAIIRDIKERKEAEETIRRAAREWRTTFDSINEMICVVNADHKVVRVNMSFAMAFNKRPEEIIGKTCYELFHGTAEPPEVCSLREAIDTKQPSVREYFEPSLGIYLEETTSPIFNEQGEVVNCVHVTRDISERKKAEENLRKIDLMKMEFLSNVSHELRTPLQSIGGFIKLLLEGKVPDAPTQQEFLQIVDRETWHLGNLINSLLDMSRLESGRFQINRRLMPVRETIVDSLKIFHTLAREKNIALTEEIEPDLPEMEVDGERLRQVVINLLSNALKFSDPGGSIKVKVVKLENEILLQVTDHGIGMSPEAVQHLFQRFYRAEDKLARGGTGLGLYITKQIIEAHGGHIRVDSKIGEGSTFYVTLPLMPNGGNSHGEKNPDN
ncbi:MAG: hypothetical protein A2Z29_06830 [Chloroflexi bacterium RBG_16_56_11]|nr:MAG: hypothetical protein A2Z29_06830 [Chloroflexi bacterium RBG_16_56_11]